MDASGISDITLFLDAAIGADDIPMAILGEAKTRILRALAQRASHGYALARALDMSLSTVYEHLVELELERLVEFEWKGRRKEWKLTKRGRALVDILQSDR